MHYDPVCLARFVRGIPYLGGRAGFPETLWRLSDVLEEYAQYLPVADKIRVERLEPLYVHARCLATFDVSMLEDLIEAFAWRGLAKGAWLTALAADRSCRDVLEAAVGRHPQQAGAVRFAISEIEGGRDPALIEHHRRIVAVRKAIRTIPVVPPKVRAFDPELAAMIERDRPTVMGIYAAQGAEAAAAYLRSRPWRHVLPSADANVSDERATDVGPGLAFPYWSFLG